jgi:hypothetical protein
MDSEEIYSVFCLLYSFFPICFFMMNVFLFT